MIKGRVYHRSFRTETTAKKYYDHLELLAAGVVETEDETVTLHDAAKRYLESRRQRARSSDTIAYYAKHFRQLEAILDGSTPLCKISDRDLLVYAEDRANDAGPATINKEVADLLRLCKAEKVQPPHWEPMSAQVKARWVRPPEEVARLWVLLEGPTQVAVGLCLFAGMRASEAMAATVSWCQWRLRELRIPVRKTGTLNRTALVDTLAELLPREGRLVQASENQVCHALRQASAKAGIEPEYSGPGAFRHHCATWAHELGYTSDQVALVLAHRQQGVTARYLHAQAVSLKREILEAVEQRFLSALG